MTQINPFDNFYFKKGLGQTEGINSPQKIDEQNSPAQIQEQEGAGNSLPKSDENDFVDMSSMIDDSGDFSSSDFTSDDENENINTDETSSTNNTENNTEQGQNNQNEDEIKEEVSQFIDDLLKKNN